jgi:hypothetical protein
VPAGERAAIIVVRAWTGNTADDVRARLIRADADGTETDVAKARGIDDVCSVVRAWLETLAERR